MINLICPINADNLCIVSSKYQVNICKATNGLRVLTVY